jgi:hypothetical protein
MEHICEACNFSTKKKNDYLRHLNTNKHNKHTTTDETEIPEITNINCTYCNKMLASKYNLISHEGICSKRIESEKDNIIKQLLDDKNKFDLEKIELQTKIAQLMKHHAELKETHEELKDDYNHYLKKILDNTMIQINN